MAYDSMVFYRSFYEAVKELPLETQGKVYTAIFAYGLDGEEVELDGVASSIFKLIKPLIDANNRRKENGKKGGRPRQEKTGNKPSDNLALTGHKPTVNRAQTEREPYVICNMENVKGNMLNAKGNMEDEEVNTRDTGKEKPNKKKAPVYFPQDELLDETFKEFIKHRKLLKHPLTDHAIDLQMKNLEKLATVNGMMDNDLAIKIINQSIEKGWQGLFEYKGDNAGGYQKTGQSIADKWRKAL